MKLQEQITKTRFASTRLNIEITNDITMEIRIENDVWEIRSAVGCSPAQSVRLATITKNGVIIAAKALGAEEVWNKAIEMMIKEVSDIVEDFKKTIEQTIPTLGKGYIEEKVE